MYAQANILTSFSLGIDHELFIQAELPEGNHISFFFNTLYRQATMILSTLQLSKLILIFFYLVLPFTNQKSDTSIQIVLEQYSLNIYRKMITVLKLFL